jgi:catechol 2,3-dioxygenase-like lactoylglutathione lyase family enzyme
VVGAKTPPFLSLDFLYTPCRDPEAEIAFYTQTLGGELLFRVRAMETEVSCIRLSADGPLLLLAEHLEGESPVLVYRVASLARTKRALKRRGWTADDEFEIPHGPMCVFRAPGGQRLAVYELTRPDANAHFMGRFDE